MTKIITSNDLKRLRISLGYTVTEYAQLLGIAHLRYHQLCQEDPHTELSDKVIARAVYLYMNFPTALPVKETFDPKAFYYWLGFKDTSKDRVRFGELIGRGSTSVNTSFTEGKSFNTRMTRYLEGFYRLKLPPKETIYAMKQVINNVNTGN